MYDAVWTAAFALDAVEKRLKAGDLPGRTSLKNFSYTDVEMKNMIFQSAKTRRFRGVTVSMDSIAPTADRICEMCQVESL